MDILNILAGKKVNLNRLLAKRNLPDLEDARLKLIENLRSLNQFDEKVLAALYAIPRHAFAPPALWRMAYSDVELWGPTAFLPRPSVVGKIAQAVLENGAQKILEYATGTGYITSVLSLLAEYVDTVEHDPWQLWLSSDAFRELEIQNISQKVSDGKLGWPERSPYDAIVVSAALPTVLTSFTSQIKDNGVFMAPIGDYYGPHRLILWNNTKEPNNTKDFGSCFFQPLLGVWQIHEYNRLQTDNINYPTTSPPSFWQERNYQPYSSPVTTNSYHNQNWFDYNNSLINTVSKPAIEGTESEIQR